ncbi:cytochrome c oxidase subunit I [Erythrobacteraceae bacterium CFH 75059]|uniref:cytochrome c oxidase subunit I n=1 Tax=Qipengyuania thermophila TaxID=2509361 RepID=UPI0010217D51|nr:cytochrome c oxidase subunit I [Qipengyuania thermophila]TCD06667.1 cytochrome c oxidase subunit I [Erythrobacteraceae bacterium CFH 75059]
MSGGRVTALGLHKQLDPLFRTPSGWGRLAATNHTDIGKRFLVTSFVFFLIGGVLAMLIRAQLATPHSGFAGPAAYNQFFTMHGTVMMFLFAIPALEGLAIYMMPKMLGARDMAFPRLGAYAYWCYLSGGSILIVAMLLGLAPDTGWFMYTPLSSQPYSPGINADVWLIGVTFVEVSSIAGAVEIAVSILKLRAPGMSLSRMPLLAWYLLVAVFMILIGFPPLVLGSVMLEIERAFGWAFFDPARGGDSILWQHLFWLFGHPEVYIIFLPAAGILSTLIPVLCRTTIVGYGWVVAAAISLGFLSFGLWVHHMFTTGIPHMGLAFFSAASTLVAVPTAIQIFAWLATMVQGRPQLRLPMLYILGFFAIFVLGGLSGVMVAVVPFNWQVHDTHFIVAHLHYVLVGGFVFPLLAGLYYWLPLVSGRRRLFRLGEVAFWLNFIGFNLTFFQMHLTGLLGMPRRVYTYPAEMGWTGLNLVSSIGGFLSAIGFALVLVDVVLQFLSGEKARRNPWNAGTLEWAGPKPPPSYNFASLPLVTGRDPLQADPDLAVRLARGEGALGRRRGERRETIGVDMVSGAAEQVVLLPGPTFLPLFAALPTGAFFLGILLKQYLLSLAGVAVALVLFLVWAWNNGQRQDEGAQDAGAGLVLPPHPEVREAPGHWGSLFTLTADASLFGSLLFGYAYLWTIAPGWPPPALLEPNSANLALGLLGVIGGWAAMRRATLAMSAGRTASVSGTLLAAAAGQIFGGVMLALVPLWLAPPPSGHAYASVTALLAAYGAFHCAVAAIMALFCWARVKRGFVSPARTLDLRVTLHWQAWAAFAGSLALLVIHGAPWVAGP